VVLSALAQSLSQVDINMQMEETLNRVNERLSNYQRISTIVIMKNGWTVENGFLTPTLKIKRNLIQKEFGHMFDEWHASPSPVFWFNS